MIHGVMGAKYKENSKEWSKKKNGIYEWVTRSKVKYVCRLDGGDKSDVSKCDAVCQNRGVLASNSVSPEMSLGEKTEIV